MVLLVRERLLAGHEARAHTDGLGPEGQRGGDASAIRDPTRGHDGTWRNGIHQRGNQRG